MNVAIVFEDAGIQQLSKGEKNETKVIYQKMQDNYEERNELLQPFSAFSLSAAP